jgi:phosphopantetheinyl transferase
MSHDPDEEPVGVTRVDVQGTSILWSCCRVRAPGKTSELRKATKLRFLRALLKNEDPTSYGLVHDRLGRPLLLRNGAIGAGISFSHCSGMTWVALTTDGSHVGIDAEQAGEFGPDYPFHSAFQMDGPDEFTQLLREFDDDRSQCAALLWSAKEAFVKALGCAFHFFSPREVNAYPLELQPDRALLRARLSDKGGKRLDFKRPPQTEISSFRVDGVWISIALADRSCAWGAMAPQTPPVKSSNTQMTK